MTGLVSGIIGASWRAGLGLATRYDVDIRTKRLDAYATLWSSIKVLDLRAKPATMTVPEARVLLEAATCWYHDTGGLLMSRATQRKFVTLQRALVRAADENASTEALIDAAALSHLVSSASALRTSTTDDVLSRRGPLLGGAQQFKRGAR
ncbi:MAG: hypothetical protein WKF96_20595 [Solirubrobacteraceae bacterium]